MHSIRLMLYATAMMAAGVLAQAGPAFSANAACPLPRQVSEDSTMQIDTTYAIPPIDAQEHATTEVAAFGLG